MKDLHIKVAALLMILAGVLGCGNPQITEIVVIGAGGAGLSAAISAGEDGAQVLVLEKMPMVGGNTLRATGGMNAAGTAQQDAKGIQDSQDVMYQDTMTGGKNLNNPELVSILVQESVEAVAWLTSLGADLTDVGRMGGHSINRTHRPTGGAAVGNHIVEVLHSRANAMDNVTIQLWSKVTQIRKEGNIFILSVENTRDGKVSEIRANTVIIAAGGFGADNEMVASFDPSLRGFGTTNHPGATGDGIILAQSIGASTTDMIQIQTHPTVVPSNGYMITEAVRGNGAILLSRTGQRFTNELGTRDVVSEATLEQPEHTSFLIFDEGVRKSLSAIETYFRLGLIEEGDTVEALAEALGIPTDKSVATILEYNSFVELGTDTRFERPDLPRALNQGPFYAIEVGPGVHHTMGGITINGNAQVLDQQGVVIPGLYAAGEVTGGVHGANRLGGNALADIVVFGRIAGHQAAGIGKN